MKKLEEFFDRSSAEQLAQIKQLKQLFEKAKQESADQVNVQLAKFKEIDHIGT